MNIKLLDLDNNDVVKYRYMHPADLGEDSHSFESSCRLTSLEERANVACIRLDKNEMYIILKGTVKILLSKRMLGGRLDKPYGVYDDENLQFNLVLDTDHHQQSNDHHDPQIKFLKDGGVHSIFDNSKFSPKKKSDKTHKVDATPVYNKRNLLEGLKLRNIESIK